MMKSNVIPPRIGDRVPYVCAKCGVRFTAKLGLLPLPARCPECGSSMTHRDMSVVF